MNMYTNNFVYSVSCQRGFASVYRHVFDHLVFYSDILKLFSPLYIFILHTDYAFCLLGVSFFSQTKYSAFANSYLSVDVFLLSMRTAM